MSITDELREWVRHIGDNQHLGILTDFGKQGLTNLADRIDAEHQKAIRELNNLADACVLLPMDADGVPIRVGDELMFRDYRTPARASYVGLTCEGWVIEDDNLGHEHKPYDCHHVQPDSWERIIEDGLRLVADNIARRTEMECGEALRQDAFDALMDGFNIGRARGYDEGFGAHLADLEARVERIEKLLSHKGAE